MRCIFCKNDCTNSRKVEHIIPESLGNTKHLLPVGVVCDACNSYFGLKVEKPLLDSAYFRQARSRNKIYNKDGRIPTVQGLFLPGGISIEMMPDSLFPTHERDQKRLIDTLRTIKYGSLIEPIIDRPDEHMMSRFLAKASLEVLASLFLTYPGELDEVVDKKELDELRQYARFGPPPVLWPFYMRAIYPEEKQFVEGAQRYTVLHEYTFLYTEEYELYFVLTIFGIEYAMNMGEPTLDGYYKWLEKNSRKSPLHLNDSEIPSNPKLFPYFKPPL